MKHFNLKFRMFDNLLFRCLVVGIFLLPAAIPLDGFAQGTTDELTKEVDIDMPSIRTLVDDSETVFRTPKKFACFYGLNDNGETSYFYAIYHDKNLEIVNPEMYKVSVELFGQELVDKMMEQHRNRTEAERWEIVTFSQQEPGFKPFEYAKSHSDDGTFFVLTRENTFPQICFFKDNKPYRCIKQVKRNWIWSRWKNTLKGSEIK